jgi:hypothetical protein
MIQTEEHIRFRKSYKREFEHHVKEPVNKHVSVISRINRSIKRKRKEKRGDKEAKTITSFRRRRGRSHRRGRD